MKQTLDAMAAQLALPLAQIEESSAYTFGTVCGSVIWCIIGIIGIVKCSRSLQRPDTHRLCVAGLLCFFAYLAITPVGSIVEVTMDQLGVFGAFLAVLVLAHFLVALGSGWLISLIGLIDFPRQAAQRPRGRSHAVWGFVLCSLFIFILSAVASVQFIRSLSDEDGSDYALSGEGDTIKEIFEDANFGVRWDLRGTGWREWYNADTDYPEALFTASKRGEVQIGIVPFWLDELSPSIDKVTEAFLLRSFSFEHPDETESARRFEHDGASGLEVRASRTIDGTDYDYVFWILRKGNMGYAVTGWTELEQSEKEMPRILAAMERLSFAEIDDRPSLDDYDEGFVEFQPALINHIGLRYYEAGDYRASLPCFLYIVDRFPDEPTWVSNAIHAYNELGEWQKSVDLVEARRQPDWDHVLLRIEYARALEALNRSDEAIDVYAEVFAEEHDDEDDLLDYVNLLVDVDRDAEALEVIRTFAGYAPSTRVSRWEVQMLSILEHYDEAVTLVESLREDNEAHESLHATHIETLYEAGRHEASLAELTAYAELHHWTPWALLARAKNELGMDAYRKAKGSLEEALKASPDDEEVLDYLDYVSSALGEGDNSGIKEEIAPVQLSSSAQALIESAVARKPEAPADDRRDTGHTIRRWSVSIRYERGKPQTTTKRFAVELLDQSSLDLFSTLTFDFDPSYERLFVNRLHVLDASGRTVAEGNADDYYVLDSNDEEMATDDRTLHLPVPGLAPGRSIEVEFTRETRGAVDEPNFDTFALFSDNPSRIRLVEISGDIEDVVHETTLPVDSRHSEDSLLWYREDTVPYVWETDQPEVWTLQPFLAIGPKGADWKALGDDYLSDLNPVLTADAEPISKLAQEIRGDAEEPREIVRQMSAYVQDTLAYKAIEFGVRGTIPIPTSETLHNRFGDCKDHSVLLKRLLEAAGVEAHLALVDTEGPAYLSVPSLDQFNHMVVYCPSAGRSPFIDATQKLFPSGELTPRGLGDRQIFVLDSDRPRFEWCAFLPEDCNRLVSERRLRLDPDQPHRLLVREQLKVSGYVAASFRGYFSDMPPASYSDNLTDMLALYSRPQITRVELQDLEDRYQPFLIELEYRAPRENAQPGYTSLPAIWERYFVSPEDSEDRETPFEISADFLIESRVELPDRNGETEAEETTPAPKPVRRESAFGQFRYQRQSIDTGNEVRWSYYRRPGKHEATDYPDYIQFREDAVRTLRRPIAVP